MYQDHKDHFGNPIEEGAEYVWARYGDHTPRFVRCFVRDVSPYGVIVAINPYAHKKTLFVNQLAPSSDLFPVPT